MRLIQKIVNAASTVLFFVAGVMLVMMMLHIVIDISAKYLFRRPLPGTIEVVAWYYMVAVAYLPVAFVQIRKQHLLVELFTLALSKRAVAAVDGLVEIVGAIYTGTLAWLVFQNALRSTRRGDVQDITYLDMPIWPASWILPVSFALLSLVFILQALLDFRYAATGKKLEEPDGTQSVQG